MIPNRLSRSTTLLLFALLAGGSALANMGGTDTSNGAALEDARAALEKKDYANAVPILEQALALEPTNADVLTWLGFAHRNLGHQDLALKYYNEALALSPGHKGAHEYIGEAYLMSGNLGKAEEHLAALDRICLTGCSELKELKTRIDAFKAGKK